MKELKKLHREWMKKGYELERRIHDGEDVSKEIKELRGLHNELTEKEQEAARQKFIKSIL